MLDVSFFDPDNNLESLEYPEQWQNCKIVQQIGI